MTYALTKYQNYQDYLEHCPLKDGNYRLLSSGEVIQLPPEDDDNLLWAFELKLLLSQLPGLRKLVRGNDTEIQVHPVGDGRMNRKPDVMVLRPEHRILFKKSRYSAIKLGMPAPIFVAELVSPGSESSDNYKRDYLWKREQYQWWGIPEYWIVDRHREKVTVLNLEADLYGSNIGSNIYTETEYTDDMTIKSVTFPTLSITPRQMLD
ncbi:MAG: Uma2 family endonuclease [Cyanobacteria bacterium J06621_11]